MMLEPFYCTVSETLSGLFVLLHLLPPQPNPALNQTQPIRPRSVQSHTIMCKGMQTYQKRPKQKRLFFYLFSHQIQKQETKYCPQILNICIMTAWQRDLKVEDG